ncbi:Gfo/Idh/MocA family oxidoreductase [Devosia neptuniae]|uniref:Gfo/Idh/MocA family oxidoreductase n=1 Tax=Devosia neptuniae TaxID=191302 RepID=A0ABY6CDC5_9HYPH|nr:Gfo/Idh/MocA family oxidoreductase [Devosia neptuniae]UXN70237.1 Gfo/Idh/MocA family oxidoreductase [Devosia neptuniae]
MQKRRVGVIGAGWVSAYHLPAWQKRSAQAEIVAIADPSEAAAQARARAFDIPAIYADVATMLAREHLDIVDICAPREAHAELVRLAARAGVAIICQKPLATDFAAAKALVADVANTTLMVHENWRFRAWYRRLREWLDAGVVGDIRQVSLEFLSSGMIAGPDGQRPALVRQPFFRNQQRLLVMEVLIHHLDTLRFLLGEMDVVAARLERSNADIVAEDVAAITLRRRSDGVLVQVMGNLAVHGAPPAPRDHLRIFGARGTIELDGNQLTAFGERPQAEQFDADLVYQGSYDAAIAHFLDCLDSGKPFETAPADNMETLRLVEAIYALAQFDPTQEPR